LQLALASLRKQAGLSQALLAERLGLGQSFVSKIERGEAYIELTLFTDWCRACGAKPGAVLDGLLAQLPDQPHPVLRPSAVLKDELPSLASAQTEIQGHGPR